MRELLIRIFTEFGFFTKEPEGAVMFFQKKEKEKIEYYLVMFLDKRGLEQYTLESLNDIQELLIAKKETSSDIDKNTSLLICVEFDSYLEDCPRYKNMLLQIEEDEFSYKKYLLPYTAAALAGFISEQSAVEQLSSLVANEESFHQFSKSIYAQETYFFAVQTFLKLPFLNLIINRDKHFVTINKLLTDKLSIAELSFMNDRLIQYSIGNSSRDQLLAAVVDPNNNAFTDFLNTFVTDDPTP